MESRDGALHFQPSLELSKLRQDVAKMKQQITGISRHAAKESNFINKSLTNVLRYGAGYLTFRGAQRFIGDIVAIRGEFQQLEVAFETMLQSKEKANAMMREVVDFAAKTPFQLTEVATGTKQLLAYRVEQEKIIPTLKALGDVSAGLGVSIQRLILNYGQVKTATKLTGRELKDFNMAGVPLIAELAKNLGKTESEINSMVSAGRIGFKDVENAFRSMTSEGGRFADLMDKQSGTITGRISNLRDNLDKMMNDIGQANEGIINDAISGVGYLVENYEEVGRIIAELIAIYGSYKAALITISAIDKARIAYMKIYNHELKYQTWLAMTSEKVSRKKARAMALEVMSHKKLTKALIIQRIEQIRANLATMANPYVLAGVAVVGLTYGVYKLATAQTDLEKSQEKINKNFTDASKAARKEEMQLNSLFGKLKAAKEGTDKYKKAKQNIISQYSSYLKGLDDEKRKLNNIEGAYNGIINKIRQKYREEAMNKSIQDAQEEYINKEAENLDKIKESLTDKMGGKKGMEVYWELVPKLQNGEDLGGELQNIIDSFDKTYKSSSYGAGGSFGITGNDLRARIEDIQEANSVFEKTKKIAEERAGVMYGKKAVDTIQEENKPLRSQADVLKEIAEQQKIINGLRKKSKTGISADEKKNLKDAESQLKLLKGELNLYTGAKTSNKTTKPTFDDITFIRNNERAKEDLKYESKIRQIRIEKDGFDEENELLKEEGKRQIALLRRQQEDKMLELEKASKEAKKAGKTFDLEGAKSSWNKLYDDLIIKTSKENGDREQKLEEGNLKELLDKYKTYEEKRTQIVENGKKERLRLVKAGGSEANLAVFDKRINARLSELDSQYAESGSRIAVFFEDAREKSLDELKQLVDEGERLLEKLADKNSVFNSDDNPFGLTEEQFYDIKGDPSKLKDFTDRLLVLKGNVESLENPFKLLGNSIKKAFDPEDTDTFEKNLAAIRRALNEVNEAVGFVSDSLNDLADGTGNETFSKIANVLNDTMEVANKTMKGAETGSKVAGQAGAIVGAVIGLGTSLSKVIAGGKDRRREREVQALQKRVDALAESYAVLNREVEKSYSIDAKKKIREQDENLRKQNETLQKQINAERRKKKSDGNRIRSWEEQIRRNNEVIKDNKDNAVDAIFGSSIQQAIDNFASAYADMWAKGDDVAKGRKDVVRDMLRNIVFQFAKSKIAEKVKSLRSYLDNAFKDEKLDKSEIDTALLIGNRIKEIQDSIYDKYKDLLKDPKEEDKEREASRKGFAAMTQDMGASLDSRFTLMTELQNQSVEISKNIQAGAKFLQNNAAKQLEHLTNIDNNTAKLQQVESGIGGINTKLEEIKTRGIKIR